ncbi:ricin-type beta-trefoil lectin domain protein [Promicromonospora sp. Populi]|uniref:RICIN domain-containing protein n=1 Tax=Promicromonospora sp. Populi TaxID=3239420 RepID=UPI0034E1EB3B
MFASSINRVRMAAEVAITAVIALSMSVFVGAPASATIPGGLMNVATSLCLDGSISQGVRLVACNTDGYQDWSTEESGPYVVFRHDATGKCLDASISNGVRLNACNGSEYQEWQWRTGSTASAFLHVGTRTIDEAQCLDGSISEGVRLKRCNNSEYQRWF